MEASAKRGNALAQSKLDAAADYPEELAYLHEWVMELHGRSGVGMHGLTLLTWECLDAWSRATGRVVYPHEAQALMALDAVLCHPEERSDG